MAEQNDYKPKTRLDNIDLLKALAMYFVVFYHFNKMPTTIIETGSRWNYLNLYLKSILSTCVPIFFFVNGLLLLNKEKIDIKKHISKIIKLIILTVLWGCITLIALSWIRGQKLSVFQIINGSWNLKLDWNNYLWFLCALVVIYVFYPLIHAAYYANKICFYFFFACVMLFTFGNVLLGNIAATLSFFFRRFMTTQFQRNYFAGFNPFRGIYGYAIGYFMLGGIANSKFCSLPGALKQKLTKMAWLAIPVSMGGLFLYAVVVSLRSKEMWDIVWNGYDTIFTLINVLAIYIISVRYRSRGWIGKCINIVGKNSLGIYLIHFIIGSSTDIFYARLPYSTVLLMNVVYAFFILLCSLLLTLTLKKIPVIKYIVSI